MNQFINRTLLLILSLGVPMMGVASGQFSQQSIVFEAPGGGTPVTLNFNGRLLSKKRGIVVDEKSKDQIAAFLHQVIDTNRSTDAEKIVALWHPDEREALLEKMENQEAMSRNSAFFINIQKSKIVGVMEYGDYLFVYALHDLLGVGDYVKAYPIAKAGDELFMTNQLSEDFFYTVIADQIIRYQWP